MQGDVRVSVLRRSMERAYGTRRAGERVGAKSHEESQQLIKITEKKKKKDSDGMKEWKHKRS